MTSEGNGQTKPPFDIILRGDLGIRCDGQLPCQQCRNATLTCKRDHVPKKRGPKRGHGRVINELRARERQQVPREFACNIHGKNAHSDGDADTEADWYAAPPTSATTTSPVSPRPPSSSFISWAPGAGGAGPDSYSRPHTRPPRPSLPFASATFRPNSRDYFYLIPQCVDLYYRHVYPIMPLLYMPWLRALVARTVHAMSASEKNLIYSLCALTSLHMSGKSLSSSAATEPPPNETARRTATATRAVTPRPSWDVVGRFFLDECLAVRQGYDFPEDTSLGAVVSSFWLSTSFFEISRDRKSWFYLREALTLALDLELEDEKSYKVCDSSNDRNNISNNCHDDENDRLNKGPLSPEWALCQRRVFWILFVTERSFAILRKKPLTLRRTPELPSRGHDYEDPEIHAGFIRLVRSYMPLDESFVNAWNDRSDDRVPATTYLHLQRILAKPLDFLISPRRKPKSATVYGRDSDSNYDSSRKRSGVDGMGHVVEEVRGEEDEDEVQIEPTAIQKADLLMTQQWLRLVVWQSSCRHGLLSTAAEEESMTFGFPLLIARDTVAVLQSLPNHAIEVHGMGIFEKIFEIAYSCVSVLGMADTHQHSRYNYQPPAFGQGGGTGPRPRTGGGMAHSRTAGAEGPAFGGMDHLRGDLSLLTQGGRSGVHTDPVEFFVRMLSASPNSRTRFAEKLLMFAGESPGSFRTALSPAPSSATSTGTASSSGARVGGGAERGLATGAEVEMVGDVAVEARGEDSNENENENGDNNKNVLILKQEFPGAGGGLSGMEGVRAIPEWVQGTAMDMSQPALSLDTQLGGMTAPSGSAAPPASAPVSVSTFSDYMTGVGDYRFGPAPMAGVPSHEFIGRVGPSAWPVPVGGAFYGEMGMATMAHEGMAGGDAMMGTVSNDHGNDNVNNNSDVPRSQPGNYMTNGMLGGAW